MLPKSLEELLPEELREGLTPAEKILLQKAPSGEQADFTVGDEDDDNPRYAKNWKGDRIVRANFLYWLCTN